MARKKEKMYSLSGRGYKVYLADGLANYERKMIQ